MTWKFKFHKEAIKSWKKLDKSIKERIAKYLLKKVIKDPFSYGKALTKNKKGLWRYRIGDYRIICKIKKKDLIIIVIDVKHRSIVYKNDLINLDFSKLKDFI